MSSQDIANLLYRYAELLDSGDFTGVGRLFAHASYGSGEAGVRGADAVEQMMRGLVITYDDGTPRTKHVTTNAIIEVREEADSATARSYFTVFQAGEGSIEPIVNGRYHDAFERVDGRWRFSERRVFVDHTGDLGRHLRIDPFRAS